MLLLNAHIFHFFHLKRRNTDWKMIYSKAASHSEQDVLTSGERAKPYPHTNSMDRRHPLTLSFEPGGQHFFLLSSSVEAHVRVIGGSRAQDSEFVNFVDRACWFCWLCPGGAAGLFSKLQVANFTNSFFVRPARGFQCCS